MRPMINRAFTSVTNFSNRIRFYYFDAFPFMTNALTIAPLFNAITFYYIASYFYIPNL